MSLAVDPVTPVPPVVPDVTEEPARADPRVGQGDRAIVKGDRITPDRAIDQRLTIPWYLLLATVIRPCPCVNRES
jgi:hypothetical protein